MTNNNEEKIVAVRKNERGNIISVKLSDGKIMSVNDAISLCKSGGLRQYHVGVNPYDNEEFLASDANTIEEDNLDNLPTF